MTAFFQALSILSFTAPQTSTTCNPEFQLRLKMNHKKTDSSVLGI